MRILVFGQAVLAGLVEECLGAGFSVTRAASAEEAVLRSAIERPQLVVCGTTVAAETLSTLRAELQKTGLEETRLLAVRENGDSLPERAGILACSRDSLLERIAELLPVAQPARRRSVRLLARLERSDRGMGATSKGFVNVLELAEDELIVEAQLPLEPQERIHLAFFLYRPGAPKPSPIAVHGRLTGTVDPQQLRYRVSIECADEDSRATLLDFLAGMSSGAGPEEPAE